MSCMPVSTKCNDIWVDFSCTGPSISELQKRSPRPGPLFYARIQINKRRRMTILLGAYAINRDCAQRMSMRIASIVPVWTPAPYGLNVRLLRVMEIKMPIKQRSKEIFWPTSSAPPDSPYVRTLQNTEARAIFPTYTKISTATAL